MSQLDTIIDNENKLGEQPLSGSLKPLKKPERLNGAQPSLTSNSNTNTIPSQSFDPFAITDDIDNSETVSDVIAPSNIQEPKELIQFFPEGKVSDNESDQVNAIAADYRLKAKEVTGGWVDVADTVIDKQFAIDNYGTDDYSEILEGIRNRAVDASKLSEIDKYRGMTKDERYNIIKPLLSADATYGETEAKYLRSIQTREEGKKATRTNAMDKLSGNLKDLTIKLSKDRDNLPSYAGAIKNAINELPRNERPGAYGLVKDYLGATGTGTEKGIFKIAATRMFDGVADGVDKGRDYGSDWALRNLSPDKENEPYNITDRNKTFIEVGSDLMNDHKLTHQDQITEDMIVGLGYSSDELEGIRKGAKLEYESRVVYGLGEALKQGDQNYLSDDGGKFDMVKGFFFDTAASGAGSIVAFSNPLTALPTFAGMYSDGVASNRFEYNMSYNDSHYLAFTTAAISASLEKLGNINLVKGMTRQSVGNTIKSKAWEFIKDGGIEGLTEISQDFADPLLQEVYSELTGEELNPDQLALVNKSYSDATNNMGTNMLLGWTLGGGMNVDGTVINKAFDIYDSDGNIDLEEDSDGTPVDKTETETETETDSPSDLDVMDEVENAVNNENLAAVLGVADEIDLDTATIEDLEVNGFADIVKMNMIPYSHKTPNDQSVMDNAHPSQLKKSIDGINGGLIGMMGESVPEGIDRLVSKLVDRLITPSNMLEFKYGNLDGYIANEVDVYVDSLYELDNLEITSATSFTAWEDGGGGHDNIMGVMSAATLGFPNKLIRKEIVIDLGELNKLKPEERGNGANTGLTYGQLKEAVYALKRADRQADNGIKVTGESIIEGIIRQRFHNVANNSPNGVNTLPSRMKDSFNAYRDNLHGDTIGQADIHYMGGRAPLTAEDIGQAVRGIVNLNYDEKGMMNAIGARPGNIQRGYHGKVDSFKPIEEGIANLKSDNPAFPNDFMAKDKHPAKITGDVGKALEKYAESDKTKPISAFVGPTIASYINRSTEAFRNRKNNSTENIANLDFKDLNNFDQTVSIAHDMVKGIDYSNNATSATMIEKASQIRSLGHVNASIEQLANIAKELEAEPNTDNVLNVQATMDMKSLLYDELFNHARLSTNQEC